MKTLKHSMTLLLLVAAQSLQAAQGGQTKESSAEYCPKTVISGSYRKHLSSLMRLKQALQNEGIAVLSPVGQEAINPKEEFILLDADPIHDKRLLQDSIFAKIRSSTFLVIANIDGYIGAAAMMELGYAIACGMQILTLEPVKDPNLAPYCRSISEVFPHLDVNWCEGKK